MRECSWQVMDGLADYGPVEQVSVDEAYVDLSNWADFTTFTRQKSVTHSVNDAATIYRLALAIW
jgi:nucleotidyltransferase/DNA polymerase involved in DNA repair